MGKTRRQKKRYGAKTDPLDGGIEDDEFGFDESTPQQTGPIEAIREQLLNANVEEKLNGLQSLAVLSNDKEKVVTICSSDIVRIAAPFLCAKELPVRNAAAGALRNLSVTGPEVCEYLVEQDVLTPLLTLLNGYVVDTEWKPSFDANMRDQMDLSSDVFLQAVNLLWNMCESTEVALNVFNEAQLLDGMMRCLDFAVYGMDIAISVAQCLLVVSENNPKAWSILNSHLPSFLQLLQVSGGHGHFYLQTLAAGILSNVPALAAAYASNILTSLAKVLDGNYCDLLSKAMSTLPQQENGQRAPELDISMDIIDETISEETEEAGALRRRRQELPTDADIVVRDVGYFIDSQRVAAEVITNLCSSDEEDWCSDDDENGSESEIVIDSKNGSMTNGGNLLDGDKLPLEVVEAIKSLALVEKLWQRAQPLPDQVQQFLRETDVSLLMKTKNLRISSLICLQNLCTALSVEDLGGPNGIYNVWVNLGEQVFKGPKDLTLLEPSTSLMRSALEHLKHKKELFSQMAEADLQLMLDGVKVCTMPEIRANWLRMLGTLGCLLPENLVKVIISFIVDTCRKEDDCWTISEALDALMDMFADNDWTQIVKELNLPELIKEIECIFKTKVRQQRRELKERYPAVQTVRTNFSRFARYIEDEATKSA